MTDETRSEPFLMVVSNFDIFCTQKCILALKNFRWFDCHICRCEKTIV